ncbi:sugar transferase [Nonomuraea soli]|uniref:Exopolysaccharide biosynthesis polyprenyl glycosylphosphotransferase n=1 Tax=Nonomuraea soli TaxID=1032476 RepID=A0A7W0HW80_9ACTN|nr:sugar transferase [Nonomuraea soli]MBA2897983.1 exopolysaccharide biosynthesis polyprenyl glycosylphosphotransferase [Nonomuraea soli]
MSTAFSLPPPQPRPATATQPRLRRHARHAVLTDSAAIAVACLIELARTMSTTLTPQKVVVGTVLCVLWPAAIGAARGYEPRFAGVGTEEFRRVFQAAATLIAVVATLAYATQTPYARGYVVVALPLATLLTLSGRHLLRKRLHGWQARGLLTHRVVAVGYPASIRALTTLLRRERHHGLDVVAACLPSTVPHRGQVDVPVAGDFSTVPEVVREYGADTVAVLACPEFDGTALRRLAWQLESGDIALYVAPALMEVAGPRTSIRPIAGLPLLHVGHPELSGYRQLAKGAFDRLAAGAILLVLAVPMLAVALLVRWTTPGPALFTQTRVGKDGQEFRLYKFRTMVADAERLKMSLAADRAGVLFKMRSDPRITRIGRVLRRYSIDELPQLVNVLRGEMSLVGPRPPLPEEVASYGADVRRRLVVRPGLTGLWQVSGRSDLSWEESVRLDLRYVENWSLTLDLQILWKTVFAVVRSSGAY